MTERSPAGPQDIGLHLLVLRCQAGDERAFANLMEQFAGKTMRYLTGLVGEDAEDVQQEVWMAVYGGVRGLSNPGAFRTWLFQTTRHRALNLLRKRKREKELIDDVPIEAVEVAAGGADESPFEIDTARMDGALASMPPPQREVLLLRYRDDLSYAEIALVVGKPIGTIRTRLHHAKKRLQELLTGDSR